MGSEKDHFQGKDARQHIVEVQAKGAFQSAEVHGAETPGSVFAAFDAAQEASVIFALFLVLLPNPSLSWLLPFWAALTLWKGGRATFLSFYRLEKLHRIVREEQREIQENRKQEKEELKELYRFKGFEGKLLDDVVEVIMADSDRALRVMLQEEMGFRLEENEHPLIQGLGAFFGVLAGGGALLLGFFTGGYIGLFVALAVVFSLCGFFSAHREKNHSISAIVWMFGLAIAALAVGYYLQ